MRRRTLAAAAALTSVLSLATPLSSAVAVQDTTLDRYRGQQVTWGSCGAQVPAALRCATLVVPRDWHRPGAGPDLKVAISRLKASNPARRHGVMLLNPGGPGGSGLFMPLSFTGMGDISGAFDLVGFDPRGVGRSTRIQCQTAEEYADFLAIDVRDRSRRNIRNMLDASRDIAEKCLQRTGSLLRYINTDQTVRDMDLIRQVLGEKKISYLGYSAGTWLGSHYATTFPKRVDRFVLDSNVQFTTTWYHSFNWQPLGFERRFTDFLAWMARYDRTYHYGTTAKATRARWEARRRALQRSPLKVSDTFTLRAGNFDSGVVGAMYSVTAFPDLAAALVTLEHFDRATPAQKERVESVFGTFFDAALYAVFYAVTCNDTPWPRSPRHYVALSDRLGRRYPLLGYSWIEQPCAFWPFQQPKPQRVTGRGLPTILMINATHDPATPYEGALLAHRALKGSRLLTVRDDGDHGQFGGNPCVNTVAARFLLQGIAPERDTTCPGLGLPTPTPTATAPSAVALSGAARDRSERRQNILELTEELTRRYGGLTVPRLTPPRTG